MSNRFHNKYHRHNHHTIPTNPARYPDSSYDPIASRESPFKGEFYSEGQITTTRSLSALETLYATDGQFYGVVNIDNTLTVVGNALFNSNVTIDQDLLVQGNATVVGNLTVSGELTYLDTIVSVTSALSVVNAGTGPALTVLQTGSQAVADFIDFEGGSALFVDGTTSAPGFVGINTRTPNERLTIVGNVSSNSDRVAFNLSQATGTRSFASGTGLASGSHSTAQGFNTVASGDFSSAEGGNTTASGLYSHAEGGGTLASGNDSHAEGDQTTASGENSHAEGISTLASGSESHAEGRLTAALGQASHAAGNRATAAQNYTYAWVGDSTLTQNVSTTRTGQYMVSASGGVFIPGNVGIGTDNNLNALTIQGTLSARGNAIITENIFVSGNEIIGGDLEIRGGDLTTNQTTFNLLNTTATTVNFAQVGTSINLGATTGTLTIGNPTVVGTQSTQNLYNTTATTVNAFGAATSLNLAATTGSTNIRNNTNVSGTLSANNNFITTANSFVSGNQIVGGDVEVRGGDLTTNQTTFNLLDATATTVNFARAATALTLGATTGSTNVRNNLNVSGILSANNNFVTTGSSFVSGNQIVGGDVEVRGGDLTTNQTTFNLLDATATTVNFARTATAITLGATTGSTNVRNNVNVSGILSANNNFITTGSSFVSGNETVGGNLFVNGTVTAQNTNISATVIDVSVSRTFSSADTNRIFHFDTTSQPLSAIFPSTLPNGFNVAVMNIGTNILELSASSLKSISNVITDQYGAAYVYKQNNDIFAIGRL